MFEAENSYSGKVKNILLSYYSIIYSISNWKCPIHIAEYYLKHDMLKDNRCRSGFGSLLTFYTNLERQTMGYLSFLLKWRKLNCILKHWVFILLTSIWRGLSSLNFMKYILKDYTWKELLHKYIYLSVWILIMNLIILEIVWYHLYV